MIINLARERRKRSGAKPPLALLGTCSTADAVLKVALSSCDEEERVALFHAITNGSYADMIVELVNRFEIGEVSSRATG